VSFFFFLTSTALHVQQAAASGGRLSEAISPQFERCQKNGDECESADDCCTDVPCEGFDVDYKVCGVQNFYVIPKVVFAKNQTRRRAAAASCVSAHVHDVPGGSVKFPAVALLAKHVAMLAMSSVATNMNAKVTTNAHAVPAVTSPVAPMKTAARVLNVKATFVPAVLVNVVLVPPMKTVAAPLASHAKTAFANSPGVWP
jgi:hypothetical protein